MEEDQEFKFVCKLCYKKYPCGKSLGGHMRSHVAANSAESDENFDAHLKNISSFGGIGQQSSLNNPKIAELGNGQSSYGLRENPRKTWRAVDSSFLSPQEKICKQCGKGFHSLKALCGHMACHSEKDRSSKDDHSWTGENKKLVIVSHSDKEAEDQIIRTRSCKGKRLKKIVIKSPFPLANNGSSSASEFDGEEQQELALCLMLLSRDPGNKGGASSVVESSDNISVILETKSSSIDMRNGKRDSLKNVYDEEEVPQLRKIGDMKLKDGAFDAEIAEMDNSDSGYFLGECANAESDVSFSEHNTTLKNGINEEYGAEFRHCLSRSKSYRTELKEDLTKENEYDNGSRASNSESRRRRCISENSELYKEYGRIKRNDPPNDEVCNTSQKRIKYECLNCKKTFKSYQALGGHRPCQQKRNTFYESIYESGQTSLDDSTEFASRGKLIACASNRKSIAKNSSEQKIKAKKNKGHVCPFCNRVFKNGQALGGHKRSHFVNNNPSPVTKQDLLDLNLPAPQEDEDDGNDQFSS